MGNYNAGIVVSIGYAAVSIYNCQGNTIGNTFFFAVQRLQRYISCRYSNCSWKLQVASWPDFRVVNAAISISIFEQFYHDLFSVHSYTIGWPIVCAISQVKSKHKLVLNYAGTQVVVASKRSKRSKLSNAICEISISSNFL